MEHTIQKPSRWSSLKPLLLGVLAGTLVCLFPPALIFVPAFWASIGFRVRFSALPLLTAAFLAGALTFYSPFGAAMLALLAGVPAMLLYALEKRKVSHATIMAAVAGTAILILYVAVCLPGILSGEGAFATVQAFIDQAVDASRGALGAFSELPAEALSAYELYLDTLSGIASDITVPILCVAGVVMGLSNALFFRLFVRKRGYDLLPLPPFRQWAIPQTYTLGICLFLIGSFVLEMMEFDAAAAVSATVAVLAGVPLIIQGLALIDFTIVRKGKHVQRRRVIFYVLIGLFFPLLETPLMLTGCAEQLLRIRDRFGSRPPDSHAAS